MNFVYIVTSTYSKHAEKKNTEKKRKQSDFHLPDGSGWGDHIQLLQIFECWHQTDYDIAWCKDNGLQVLYLITNRENLQKIWMIHMNYSGVT